MRNNTYHEYVQEFLNIVKDASLPEELRTIMAETLGWFVLSPRKQEIINVCEELIPTLPEGELKGELTQTRGRLLDFSGAETTSITEIKTHKSLKTKTIYVVEVEYTDRLDRDNKGDDCGLAACGNIGHTHLFEQIYLCVLLFPDDPCEIEIDFGELNNSMLLCRCTYRRWSACPSCHSLLNTFPASSGGGIIIFKILKNAEKCDILIISLIFGVFLSGKRFLRYRKMLSLCQQELLKSCLK